jgi:sugar phosphate isomerase/epimerase
VDRRTFIGSAAAAITAQGATESRRVMPYHLSCGAIGVKADQRQSINYAAEFGFDCVDANGAFLASLSDSELMALRDDMTSRKIGWALAGLPVDFRRDEAQFEEGFAKLPDLAKALERARVERVTTWVLPSHPSRTYLENFHLHAERLGKIARVLNDHGIRFGLEYVAPRTSMNAQKYPFIHTLAEMRDLIREMRAPSVGIVLDSWHWYCAGDTAGEVRSLKASDVVSVDLNDAPAGIPVDQQQDSKRELPAATGVIDIKTFLSALRAIGYAGPVRAEPFNEAVRKMRPEDALRATKAALDKAFATVA